MQHTLTCKQCGNTFEWRSPYKSYCTACQLLRDKACRKRHRKAKVNTHKKPNGRKRITAYADDILRMVREGMSDQRIAMAIGFDLDYLRECIRNRKLFTEIRRAIRDRENEDIQRDVMAFAKSITPERYIPANTQTMLQAAGRSAAWLFSGGSE